MYFCKDLEDFSLNKHSNIAFLMGLKSLFFNGNNGHILTHELHDC